MMRGSCLVVVFLVGMVLAQAVPPRAASPDRKLEATAKGKTITVSQGQGGKILMKIAAHTSDITALAYSPDGKFLVSGDKNGSVKVFDGATGKEILSLKALVGITKVEVSADARTISAVSGAATKKFDLATGKEVK